ncbi:MAG: outer membrane beta-barrel protein [Desulfuromonadales bacterium]|nr:outer membrane beta-barrel protein [Desulfuromonadales bacterium]
MKRKLSSVLIVLLACGVLVSTAAAAEEQVAKVYRDYPGYLSPPLCDNPRLTKAEGAVAAGETCRVMAHQGLYLGVWGGGTTLRDKSYSAPGGALKVDYDTGYAVGVVAGYDFGHLRLELDGGYRDLDVDRLGDSPLVDGSRADLTLSSVLLNLYYDIPVSSPVTPYVGAGAGVAWVELDDLRIVGQKQSDEDRVLAGQIGAGVRFPLCRHALVDFGYRYLFTEDPEFKVNSVKAETKISNHTVLVGLNVLF